MKTVLPELLWIGLIQYRYGHRRGVELITSLARLACAICPSAKSTLIAATSKISVLSLSEGEQLRHAMAERGELLPVQDALEPLVSWYPECPFRLLFEGTPLIPSREGFQRVKTVVSSLYVRSDRDPMMVQATAVWLAFDTGMLKVNRGLALAQFPEIERYPETDLSRKVGASIRATMNMFVGSDNYLWPRYFWNRGLEISPCDFTDG